MDGLDGAKGYLGDKGEDCKVCPDGKKKLGICFEFSLKCICLPLWTLNVATRLLYTKYFPT